MHRSVQWIAVAGLLALAAESGDARAQGRVMTPLGGEPPTRGVRLSDPSLVSGADATAVEINPGTLGMIPAWSVYFHHAELRRKGRMYGGGNGLWAAAPLPYVSSVVVGAGVQWLRPADAMGYDDSAKLSLALSWSWQQLFSIGLGYHVLVTHDESPQNHLQTLDIGMVFRPFEFVGAGFVVRDVTSSLFDGLPLQRLYEFELLGRPFSNHRLEVSAAVRFSERRGEVDPRFRLMMEPLAGLRLYSTVELVRRDFFRQESPMTDVRATAGIALHLEQLEVSLSTMLGRPLSPASGPARDDDVDSVVQGLGVGLRLEGSRREPLVGGRRRIMVLRLKGEMPERTFARLVARLRRVERRSDVKGVLLHLDGAQLGGAQAHELRGWFTRLRRAGKRSYAYLRSAGHHEYHAATAADRVMLDPAGGLRLRGMAVRTLFFRGALDALGVEPHFVRIAEFKGAPESYTRTTASEPVRKMRRAMLDDLYNRFVADLARDRKKNTKDIKELIDKGPFTPPRALAAGLVDQLVEPGELDEAIKKLSDGQPVHADDLNRRPDRWLVGPQVAVVLVEGDIVRGRSTRIPLLGYSLVGDETVVAALAQAREDSSVRAVVLRVNSPGGSAMASHRIWREVMRTRRVKPVIVSMGNVAASGGYYLACGGDRIYAEPSTITGSIGIFTGKVDVSGLLAKLGVTRDAISRGKNALLDAWDRPYSESQRQQVRSRLQYYYKLFLKAVEQGRAMTQKEVIKRAGGRVWTGRQAKQQGLVDELGGLGDAIEEARRRVGLAPDRPVQVRVLPVQKKGLLRKAVDLLAREGATDARVNWIPQQLLPLLRSLPGSLFVARAGEPLARLPFQIKID